MTRTPQSVELLSLEEIAAIKQQLIETTKLLEDAEKLANEKEHEGLMVLYKTGLLRVEASPGGYTQVFTSRSLRHGWARSVDLRQGKAAVSCRSE